MSPFPSVGKSAIIMVMAKRVLKKRLIIVACLLAAIALAGAIYWFVFVHSTQTKQPTANPTQTTVSNLNTLLTNTSKSGAEKTQSINEAISNTSDDVQKALLYDANASVLWSDGKLQDALAAAEQAVALHPTYNFAGKAGDIAYDAGNKTLAAKYYKQALSLTDSEIVSEDDIARYQKRAAEGGA